MRAFQMDITYSEYGFDPKRNRSHSHWVDFLKLNRDYQCTCCCCNRPVIEVFNCYQGGQHKIGYVKDKWTCFDYSFYIYDTKSEDPVYMLNGSCCQCGFHCHCPCGPCKAITFDLLDLRKDSVRVGEVRKVWSSCAKEMFSNADDYSVLFPQAIPWEHKALILACVLFVDYRYFEERTDDGKRANGHQVH